MNMASNTSADEVFEYMGNDQRAPYDVVEVRLHSSVTEIGRNAFNECNRLEKIVLNDGLQRIGLWAFYRCRQLEFINIPSTLIEIGESAFLTCRKLKVKSLNEGLREIGKFAFEDCRQIESMTLPSTLIHINDDAFKGCVRMRKVDFNRMNHSKLKKIGRSAFEGCTSLQSISLPSSLTEIVSLLDVTLSEEIKRSGLQIVCSQLVTQINKLTNKLVEDDLYTEENEDTLVLLQDLVFELYTPAGNNESSNMAFTNDELISRLPLVYNLMPASSHGRGDNGIQLDRSVFINQVSKRQSAQVDVGYVMWPSAIILSRWLISNPNVIRDKTILELGAGCGLVGIVAARILSSQKSISRIEEEDSQQVIITDVNELVIENIQQNINLNDMSSIACVAKLDFYVQTGTNYSGKWIASAADDSVAKEVPETESGDIREPVDVILAADIICQPSDSVAASKTIYDALKPGGVAYVVCANSEHRFGVEIFASECEARGLDVTTTNVSDMYDGDLQSDLQLHTAAGYIEGMLLTFFEITKQ